MINRRRFLAISAAALATPAAAQPTKWHGYALGAEVSLTFDASPDVAEPAIARIRAELERCEALFSLYRPNSDLSRLNRSGHLKAPAPEMLALLRACDRAYRQTDGRFDPTVQPLWQAAAQNGDLDAARKALGWDRVRISRDLIALDPGQALTLNGIAQGYATDLVTEVLRQAGWRNVLVNIGEYYAAGRNWTLGVSDPQFGMVQTRTLKDQAIATSSPGALRLDGGTFHVLNPKTVQPPVWSTVCVQAKDAASADALSTALCHADEDGIETTLDRTSKNITVICVDHNGSIRTFRS